MCTSRRGLQGLGAAILLLVFSGTCLAIDNWDASGTNDNSAATKNALLPGDPPQRHDFDFAGIAATDEDWYRLATAAGHSYEIRVTGRNQNACFDLAGASASNFQIRDSDGVTVLAMGADYPGLGVTDPTNAASYTASFVAPTTAPRFVRLRGSNLAGGVPNCGPNDQYTIEFFDTTLFSPRWSTFGGFYTSWGIQNLSSDPITGTLKVVNTAGTTVATTTFSIPAGQVVFRDTRATDLALAANQAGNVIFTYIGPAGAILADAFMVNESGSVFVTIVAKFERAVKGD